MKAYQLTAWQTPPQMREVPVLGVRPEDLLERLEWSPGETTAGRFV